jgi:hypothetical protein
MSGASRRATASRPIPETVSYVAAILGMLTGAGDLSAGAGGLEVRLVA